MSNHEIYVTVRRPVRPVPSAQDRAAFQAAAVRGDWNALNHLVTSGVFDGDEEPLGPEACAALDLRPGSTFDHANKLRITVTVVEEPREPVIVWVTVVEEPRA